MVIAAEVRRHWRPSGSDVSHRARAVLPPPPSHVRASSSSQAQRLIQDISSAVFQEYNLAVFDVVLLLSGSLPKTTSGKLRRFACNQAYSTGSWKALAAIKYAALAHQSDSRGALVMSVLVALIAVGVALGLALWLGYR